MPSELAAARASVARPHGSSSALPGPHPAVAPLLFHEAVWMHQHLQGSFRHVLGPGDFDQFPDPPSRAAAARVRPRRSPWCPGCARSQRCMPAESHHPSLRSPRVLPHRACRVAGLASVPQDRHRPVCKDLSKTRARLPGRIRACLSEQFQRESNERDSKADTEGEWQPARHRGHGRHRREYRDAAADRGAGPLHSR
jgi:hypothetical protein